MNAFWILLIVIWTQALRRKREQEVIAELDPKPLFREPEARFTATVVILAIAACVSAEVARYFWGN